jgi:hypothetical protein
LGAQVTGVKADVAGVATSQREAMDRLRDIADKLDATRMRRPDIQSSVAVVMAILLMGAAVLKPLYDRLHEADTERDAMRATQIKLLQEVAAHNARECTAHE